MEALVITLPLPSRPLSPNVRSHWAAKGRATAKAREDSHMAALAAIGSARPAPRWHSATVQATFYHAAKRRRDPDNLNASLKAYRDGLQDADVVVDDSGLIPLPPVQKIDRDDPRVVLVVKQWEAADAAEGE